jgi:hypothetical protein
VVFRSPPASSRSRGFLSEHETRRGAGPLAISSSALGAGREREEGLIAIVVAVWELVTVAERMGGRTTSPYSSVVRLLEDAGSSSHRRRSLH